VQAATLAARAAVVMSVFAVPVGVVGCDTQARDASHGSRSATTDSLSGYVRGDFDDDDTGGYDEDDAPTRTSGVRTGEADRRAVETLVQRYYAAAARGDGRGACRLLGSNLKQSRNFTKALPRGYMPAGDPSIFRETTCPHVAALLFEVEEKQLAEDAASVKVVEVRVKRSTGLAVLVFKRAPEGEIAVEREAGRWKIDAFLGVALL